MQVHKLEPSIIAKLRSSLKINSVTQCITELVLNSLDAKSTAVAVRVNLVTLRIQVVDNGEGITKDNLDHLGQRYMTSKCNRLEQLKSCHAYYGFRGEALASIINISETVEITSKYKHSSETYNKTFKRANESYVISVKDRPSYGTTVTIEGFLYNLPLRMKRVTPELELVNVKKQIEYLIIVHPNVSFTLRNDVTGDLVLNSKKCANIVSSFKSLHPEIDGDDSCLIKVSKGCVAVKGLLFKRMVDDNCLQFIYVNKRPVSSSKIQTYVNNIIRRNTKEVNSLILQEKNKHPIYVLNIKCPYCFVDIFLSPTKTTVEFQNWDIVFSCIEKLIYSFLGNDVKINKQNKTKICRSLKRDGGISEIYGAFRSYGFKHNNNSKIRKSTSSAMENNSFVEINQLTQNTDHNKNKRKGIVTDENQCIYKQNKKRKEGTDLLKNTDKLPYKDKEEIKNIDDSDKIEDGSNQQTCGDDKESKRKATNVAKLKYVSHKTVHPLPIKFTRKKSNIRIREIEKYCTKSVAGKVDNDNNLELDIHKTTKPKFTRDENKDKNFIMGMFLKSKSYNEYDPRNEDTNLEIQSNYFHENFFEINDDGKKKEIVSENLLSNAKYKNVNLCKPTRNVDELNYKAKEKEKANNLPDKVYQLPVRIFDEKMSNKTESDNNIGLDIHKLPNEKSFLSKFTCDEVKGKNLIMDMFLKSTQGYNEYDPGSEDTNLELKSNYFLEESEKKQKQYLKPLSNTKFKNTSLFETTRNIDELNYKFKELQKANNSPGIVYPLPVRMFNTKLNNLKKINKTENDNNRELDIHKLRNDKSFLSKFTYNEDTNLEIQSNYFHKDFFEINDGKKKETESENLLSNTKYKNFSLFKPTRNVDDLNYKFKEMEKANNLPDKAYRLPVRILDEKMSNLRKINKTECDNNIGLDIHKLPNEKSFLSKFTYDENKGKNLIMDMFLKSTQVYNSEYDSQSEKKSEDTVLELQSNYFIENNITTNVNGKSKTMSVSVNITRKFKRKRNRDKRRCTSKSIQTSLDKKVSKCVQTSIYHKSNEVNKSNENIYNNTKLAENCTVTLSTTQRHIPHFKFIYQTPFSTYGNNMPLNENKCKCNCHANYKIFDFSKYVQSTQNQDIQNVYNSDLRRIPLSPIEKCETYTKETKKKRTQTIFTYDNLVNHESDNKKQERLIEKNPINQKLDLKSFRFKNKTNGYNFFSPNKRNHIFDETFNFRAEYIHTRRNFNEEYIDSALLEKNDEYNNFTISKLQRQENSSKNNYHITEAYSTDFITENTNTIKRNPKEDNQQSILGKMYNPTFEFNATNLHLDPAENTKLFITLSNRQKQEILESELNNEKMFCNEFNAEWKSQLAAYNEKENRVKEFESGIEGEWIKKVNNFGSTFYINTKTGFTTFGTPKLISNDFQLCKRFEFMPKGLSPIMKDIKEVDETLSQNKKDKLEMYILESHQDELLIIKWLNYIKNNDPKTFFNEVYREKLNSLETCIPRACVLEHKKYLVESNNALTFNKDLFSSIIMIGQVDKKFIAVLEEKKNLLILFDQHAVHERIRLEELLEGYSTARVPLHGDKFIIFLSPDDLSLLKHHEKYIHSLGLSIEFYKDGINIVEIPLCLYNKFKENNISLNSIIQLLFKEIIDSIKETAGVTFKGLPKIIQNVINLEACRGAIKFGDILSNYDCVDLLKKLSSCNLPFQCAHGRPTLVPLVCLNLTNQTVPKHTNLKKLLD